MASVKNTDNGWPKASKHVAGLAGSRQVAHDPMGSHRHTASPNHSFSIQTTNARKALDLSTTSTTTSGFTITITTANTLLLILPLAVEPAKPVGGSFKNPPPLCLPS